MLESDDGVRAEDLFRRAAFHWAASTKNMVEKSAALGNNTRVARAALADIEYARELLNKLFMPTAVKLTTVVEGDKFPTAEEVKETVADLAVRVIKLPVFPDPSELQAHVDDIVDAPLIVRKPAPKEAKKPSLVVVGEEQKHRSADFSAPVHPQNGKMLWAGVDCPVCPSKATQRCQKADGSFIEKPHAQRKSLVENS